MQRRFEVAGGLSIAADVGGDSRRPPVVLLHGGGQTRHSWRTAFDALVDANYFVVSLDARGHGESDWDRAGDYGLDAFISDLRSVLSQISSQPVLIGASLGGMTALAAVGEADESIARALVLVDITPTVDTKGTDHIAAFMRASPNGFATVDEAADAVSRYNPNRPRPGDVSGLKRNLREVDGRFYWHWDPKFLGHGELEPRILQARLEEATRRISVPTLLIRGTRSDIVGDEQVARFRELIPTAEYVGVEGAGHMVAGDRNDAFNTGVLNFIARLDRDAGSDRA